MFKNFPVVPTLDFMSHKLCGFLFYETIGNESLISVPLPHFCEKHQQFNKCHFYIDIHFMMIVMLFQLSFLGPGMCIYDYKINLNTFDKSFINIFLNKKNIKDIFKLTLVNTICNQSPTSTFKIKLLYKCSCCKDIHMSIILTFSL